MNMFKSNAIQAIGILVAALTLNSNATAQRGPDTLFTSIYVTDAIGNVDTLTIRAHPDASSSLLDPALGETADDYPFDTIFDARFLVNGDSPQRGWTKNLVKRGENSSGIACLNQISVSLIVHAIHQPITISWDKAYFQTRCLRSSGITDGTTYLREFPPIDYYDDPAQNGINYSWACLAVDSSITLDSSRELDQRWSAFAPLELLLSNGDTSMINYIILNLNEITVTAPCHNAYQVSPVHQNQLIEGATIWQVPHQPLVQVQGLPLGKYQLEWMTLLGQVIAKENLDNPGDETLIHDIVVPKSTGTLFLKITANNGQFLSGVIMQ